MNKLKEIYINDLLAMIGSLLVVFVWFYLFIKTKRKLFILLGVITIIANIYSFKEQGFNFESFKNLIM